MSEQWAAPPLEPGEQPYGDPELTGLWWDPDDWADEEPDPEVPDPEVPDPEVPS